MKIRIDVPCYNRKKITELCLIQLNKAKTIDTEIRLYNDNSTEYDNKWLSQFGTVVNYIMPNQPKWKNIHTIRYLAYLDFLKEDFDYLYMTDNDAFHDIEFLSKLINISNETNLPSCGYISKFMSSFSSSYLTQVKQQNKHKIINSTNGGISVFLSKEQVTQLIKTYDPNNIMWDCLTWRILHNKYVLPENSYLDHYGKGGLHNKDWNFDYALYPTPYLKKLRTPIINYLENNISRDEILKII